MHVMFVPSWYHNKRNPVHGSFFKEQAQALQEAGVKITVAYNEIWPLTLLGRVKERVGLSYKIEDNLKTYRYKNFNYLPKNSKMFSIFNKRLEKLYKEITKNEGKVDIIHCQSSFWAGISCLYIAQKYNIPLIITEHSSLKRAVYIKNSYIPLVKKSYLGADVLIAVGNGLKNELYELTGRKDIRVINNLLPTENFYINEYKNEDFTFFSLAFLEGEKGMDVLIKAFAKYFNNKNAKLIIGGDGSQKQELIKLCKNLNLEGQVKFLGALNREEVAYHMSKCDAFVLASKHETFGVVYIEALASGKPIIGTYNGGAEDIINENNGLLVEVDNVDALGKAMVKIKENIAIYNSEEIRKECIEKYSKEAVTRKIINVYNSLLQ
ncbi:glycosyltransferase [Caproiciproducens sp. MSJ-32]|uniref:glycosyltransferase n=1 Tax=Caproiciproducens sp. MSJ-32 TaxID=2841527 RepID=UPI001C102524|nr:glycosyltransferase [Caproiciproducens sp. MSJ-32]MBU5456191.1 glycosyltransferase [Caproiciproducens sp. MSJ-32]